MGVELNGYNDGFMHSPDNENKNSLCVCARVCTISLTEGHSFLIVLYLGNLLLAGLNLQFSAETLHKLFLHRAVGHGQEPLHQL